MSFLTGSANCIKYTLFAFNLVFIITGIILIAVGAGVAGTFEEYDSFLKSNFYSITTFLIVIGVFIFIIAFFGCCGAIKENYWMILIFSVLLGLIFILELAAGISGYVLRNQTQDLISEKLNQTMLEYKTNPTISNLWDYTQREFTCCGTNDYTDWKLETKVNLANNYTADALPISCCAMPPGEIGSFYCVALNGDMNRYADGCLTEFSSYISAHAVSLGAAGVIIAIIQFFGVLFACYIAREIKIRDGISGFM
ncbi:hypothetical protein ACFFRR_005260 [Megaselia abdita]